jgi:hypothetical protein
MPRSPNGVRLTVFSDAAWAGPRSRFGSDDVLASFGIGASFLDGLFRIDLARGRRASDSWRLHLGGS